MHLRKALGAIVAAALLLTIAAVPAHADTYAPNPVDQDFSGSAGGWTQSASYSQLCVQTLVCPAVANTYAGGGADGNGYIRTQFATFLETMPGTSTGTWESPAFTYDGAGGKTPASVTFDMNVLKDLGALLDLTVLNQASYGVDLVDQADGTGISIVPTTQIASNAGWTALPSVSVNPAQLKLGHSYKIRISTSYTATLTVVANGEVGYDDVRLTTAAAPGSGPTVKNGGSGVTDIKQLRKLTKTYILPASAKVKGHLLVVKLRCPAIASPKPCQIQLAGLQAGRFSKAATARKVVKLKAGTARTVKIRIKPKYVASYHAAKKIWTKAIVRVGKVRVTVRQRMKV